MQTCRLRRGMLEWRRLLELCLRFGSGCARLCAVMMTVTEGFGCQRWRAITRRASSVQREATVRRHAVKEFGT